MFQQIYTIGRNTFLESIRQPVYVVLVMVVSMILILNTFMSAYTLDDDNKLLVDMGLSTLLLAGMLISVFAASSAISTEIENKTVLTVVSKPVGRPIFILGKFAGVGAAAGLAIYVLGLVLLFSVRHKVMQSAADEWDGPVLTFGFGAAFLALIVATVGNYMYNWVWPSTFAVTLAILESVAYLLVLVLSPEWEFQSIGAEFVAKDSQLGQLMVVMTLVFEAVLILAAIAVACSTRLGQVMTLCICLMVFALGLVSEPVFGKFLEDFDPGRYSTVLGIVLKTGAHLMYAITPNLQFLWQADALTNHYTVAMEHVAYVSGYALLQVTAFLSLAVALFQTREVG